MVRSISSVALKGALAGLLLTIFASAPTMPVLAQDQRIESLVEQVGRLQRDLAALSRQVYRGGAPSGGGGAAASSDAQIPGGSDYILRIDSRISQLEGELRNLTGTVEGLTHTTNQLTSRLDTLVTDLEARLSQLETGGRDGDSSSRAPRGSGSAQAATVPSLSEVPPPGSGVLGTMPQRERQQAQRSPQASGSSGGQRGGAAEQTAALPEGTPQQQYDFALSLLSKGDYPAASQAFQEFVDKHPSGPLSSNARYWLGETYYVRRDYRSAAEVFLDGYQKDAKGPKAPDTLLKLGMSLTNIDKKKEACATFDKLAKDFPDASANIKRVLPRERGRADCG